LIVQDALAFAFVLRRDFGTFPHPPEALVIRSLGERYHEGENRTDNQASSVGPQLDEPIHEKSLRHATPGRLLGEQEAHTPRGDHDLLPGTEANGGKRR
jgi:hypothetical protein